MAPLHLPIYRCKRMGMSDSKEPNWEWASSTNISFTLTYLVQFITPVLLSHYSYYIGAHRALADVKAMKAIFTHLNCLGKVEIRSPSQQLKLWKAQRRTYHRTTSLVSSLGKPSITAPQAKRLDCLGFTITSLLHLYR